MCSTIGFENLKNQTKTPLISLVANIELGQEHKLNRPPSTVCSKDMVNLMARNLIEVIANGQPFALVKKSSPCAGGSQRIS